jgi:hypothetical protein
MPRLDRDDIIRLFGPISDHTIVEVLGAAANLKDLELAALRLTREDDAVSAAREQLSGAASVIYDIVRHDPLYVESRERERGGAA